LWKIIFEKTIGLKLKGGLDKKRPKKVADLGPQNRSSLCQSYCLTELRLRLTLIDVFAN